LNDEGNLLR